MSRNFSIEFTLLASYENMKNILKILENGKNLGFIYYDHHIGLSYEDAPVLTPKEALEKIIHAKEMNIEDGPTVFTNIGNTNYVFLSFYENMGLIKCNFWGMRPIIRKSFEENIFEIDFEFYVRIMLQLCHGFALKNIKLEEY